MLQDTKASDSYENAMTVMQINPLLKTAMRQLKGIRLEATDEEMVLTLLSRFSWFRVKQNLPPGDSFIITSHFTFAILSFSDNMLELRESCQQGRY